MGGEQPVFTPETSQAAVSCLPIPAFLFHSDAFGQGFGAYRRYSAAGLLSW